LNPLGLTAFNPGPLTGRGNWTWLLNGRVPTLIDAGVGDPKHLQSIVDALAGMPLAQVLVTHGHSDHASGAPAILERLPSARFFKMPWPERDQRYGVDWMPIADGELFEAGDTTLQAIHTPGHAPDHLCFWHADTRTVLCGDLAIKGTTVWIPGNLQGDLAAYIASLERILALRPARMLPAHGPVIEDPATLLVRYIEHRREREQQVIDALRRGDTTAAAIVTRIYEGLLPGVAAHAQDTVTAHLRKLEREGRVRAADGAWHIMEP
jgi:glyoxylase-like metal-dependent hydrolase (beta-lactamase superfamily II)